MYDVTVAIEKAHAPFTLVSPEGDDSVLGFISEVSINKCQPDINDQLSYSITWLKEGTGLHTAWWKHDELNTHGNLMTKIAEGMCHPAGNNAKWVKQLIG